MSNAHVLYANMAADVQPKADPSGCPTVVFATAASGAALSTTIGAARAASPAGIGSSGEVTLLAKLPSQARVSGLAGSVFSNAGTSTLVRACLCEVKTPGSAGTLSASIIAYLTPTLTAVAAGISITFNGAALGTKVSLSDDAAVNYAAIGLVGVGGTATLSMSFDLAFTYVVSSVQGT
jgi:hypothetical protein